MSKKGLFYYEVQFLMFVFMWQHNMNYKPQRKDGIRIKRLHIWYDTAWTHHGPPNEIRYWFEENGFFKGVRSLLSYWRLYRSGFRILHYIDKKGDYERYRFFWKDNMIRTFPDINRVGDHYSTTNNGHVEPLEPKIKGIKPSFIIEDEYVEKDIRAGGF